MVVHFKVNSKNNTNSLPKSVVATYNGSQPTGECGIFQLFREHENDLCKMYTSRFVKAKAAFNKKNVHQQIGLKFKE